MTNRNRLKRVIEEDMNPKNYYNSIIETIGEREKGIMNNNIIKWSLVPICLVAIISGSLFMNYRDNNKTIINENQSNFNNRGLLNINEINIPKEELKLDADAKIVTGNDVNFPLPYKNGIVSIPKDLDKSYLYIFYTRENIDSKNYNILNNYEIIYSNDNDRSINVKYSKEHKPLRDYYFSEEGSKITIINNVSLKIYKFENNYLTEFKFNDYYFDIETSNITEQEFYSFLISILNK